jgi:hypothetical protein
MQQQLQVKLLQETKQKKKSEHGKKQKISSVNNGIMYDHEINGMKSHEKTLHVQYDFYEQGMRLLNE